MVDEIFSGVYLCMWVKINLYLAHFFLHRWFRLTWQKIKQQVIFASALASGLISLVFSFFFFFFFFSRFFSTPTNRHE